MSIYDDPDVRVGGDYIKFENVGDGVTGDIVHIGKHSFDDGKTVIKLIIDTDDGEKTLTASQVQLAQKLQEVRPDIGDRVSIKFTGLENRGGGKTLKLFEVKKKAGVAKPVEAEEEPF